MKTTILNPGPDVPVRRFASLIMIQAINDSSSEIIIKTNGEPRISLDNTVLSKPPDHLMVHLVDAYLKIAGCIKWRRTSRISGKRFCTIFEGKPSFWILNSENINHGIRIKREKNNSQP